ncbi:arylmalonate decarboxylase [Streptomyces sp. NRRL S-1022]|uniref:maleate cis-trans isomerase family protein n=1 Tax=Streptomyces sp. NRRL S-1022 TaxID=1463880 RepID=UPI0004C11C1E|nr:arylmalonate decarboxylase [Streptomyces sp. NRRL S-1022]
MDIFPLPRLGLVVPPENPLAEPEFNRLIGTELNVYTTRFPLTPGMGVKETMLRYNDVLADTLATFGGMRLDASVVACNASHYLLGPDGDRAFVAELSEAFGYPVQSTTQAILAVCEELGISRLTLVSPYWDWLTETSRSFWEQAGVAVDRVVLAPAVVDPKEQDHEFDPYRVTTRTLLGRIREAGLPDDGAILFTGTGMGTLAALAELDREFGRTTLLTSNLAAAWWARRAVGAAGAEVHPLLERLERGAPRRTR